LDISDAKISKGLVGKQCTSLVLPSDPNADALGEYHPDKVTNKIYIPDYIEARGCDYGAFVIAKPEFQFLDYSGKPSLVIPKVASNAPCPCGSEKKYKRCHGRHKKGEMFTTKFGGKPEQDS
jgi:hypothetical protein